MATATTTPAAIPARKTPPNYRRYAIQLGYLALVALMTYFLSIGFRYYTSPVSRRAASPLHPLLKPSGTVGLQMGIYGLCLFVVLFLYPIRKNVAWLNRIGKTKNWLDVHILCGIAAPLLITLHSSFKMSGIAGVAYWIMMSVAASGFIGRYVYGQIPRRLNTAELSHRELDTAVAELAAQMETFSFFTQDELADLQRLPSREEVLNMSVLTALVCMIALDVKRPFQVRKLRVRFLAQKERMRTLGGLLRSKNEDLERMISTVRRQAWLRAKILFLEQMQRIFHLWHVIHRPFSYSFAALVVVHLAVVILMGYY